MKFVGYKQGSKNNLGVLHNNEVIDLRRACEDQAVGQEIFADMLSLIRAGEEGQQLAQACIDRATEDVRIPATEVSLCARVRPATILCSGSNYHAHNAEKADSPVSGLEPEFFVKTADCVVGPDEPIIYDERLTKKLDCETELAVIIGKPGRHIAVEDALGHSHIEVFAVRGSVCGTDNEVNSPASRTTRT